MKALLRVPLLLASLFVFPAWGRQDPLQVNAAVQDFLRVQTQGLPGRVSFTVNSIDPDNNLLPCPAPLDVSLPPGSRPWGRINVTVRCPVDKGWGLYVRAQIHVITDFLVAARPVAQGQALTDSDLARQTGDLSDLPTGILTDAGQAIGRTAALSIPAGRPLRSDMLRAAVVVQQNQSVKVVSKGAGFQVSSEGRALTNGVEGQVVQVRLGSGQITSGIARAGGIVEVAY